MINHKTPKGAAALGKYNFYSGRLKLFEGVPAPYDTKKRQVIPDALRCVKLTSFRKFCVLGDLSSQVGWGKQKLINQLEDNRRKRATTWHKARLQKQATVRKSVNQKEIDAIRSKLAEYGY